MAGATSFTISGLLLLASPIFLIGLALLQIILSKKQNESLGYILPISTFVISIISILTMGVLDFKASSFNEYIIVIIFWFLIFNLPTIEYLIIYSICRKKVNAKKEIEKMNILDLE